MRQQKEKRFSGRKALYMVFSILASVFLWLYISITDMPDTSMAVPGIRVELSGTDILEDRSLVVTDISHETISIRFSGARVKVILLTNEHVHVTLDVSKIDAPGKYQLKPVPVYDNSVNTESISVSSTSTDYITVTVDNLVTKEIEVHGSFDGNVADGFLAQPITVEPGTISVSGPGKVISEVSSAIVSYEAEALSTSVDTDLPITLIDKNSEPIESKYITMSQDTANFKMSVDMVKEIPLSINYIYGAGTSETSNNVITTINPSTIKISGDATVLNELSSIVLGTIDLTKFSVSTTEQIPIVIPNDCINITGTAEATVMVEVTGLSTKKLSATNIQMTNQTAGYTSTLITQSLDITLRGDEESLENITSDNIRIVADLSEVSNTVGTYTVRAKVYVDGFGDVGAVGENMVTVSITKG